MGNGYVAQQRSYCQQRQCKQRKMPQSEQRKIAKTPRSRNFNEDDRKTLNEIQGTVESFKNEIEELRNELKISNREIEHLKIENGDLKRVINLNTLQLNDMQQYNRRENIRVYGVQEAKSSKNDGETVTLNVANTLGVNLRPADIQHARRLGKKKGNVEKPRPIIVRFVSYKKMNELFCKKSELKKSKDYKNAFVVEDITPLRQQLLNYVKNECDGEFVLCHTYNGKIRMKKSARKNGDLNIDDKDEGIGDWITITSPDDLFQHDINIDFKKLYYVPLKIN